MGARKRERRRFGKVYKRRGADGVWTYYAQWREHRRGRRQTRAVGGSIKDAEKFLDEIEESLRLGKYAPPPTVAEIADAAVPVPAPAVEDRRFVDYAQDVLDKRLATTKAEATVALYTANLKALRAFFGDRTTGSGSVPARRLSEVTKLTMSDYRVWRKTWRGDAKPIADDEDGSDGESAVCKAISDATINRDCQFASVVLSHAVAEGLLPAHPLQGFKKLREERRARRFMSKAEVAKLLIAADEQFRTFLLAALYTGARPCELRELRWRDVSFDNAKLTIYRRKVRKGDALDLHPTLAAELRRVKDGRGEADAGDHVFLNCEGSPWWDQRKAWQRTLKAAKLAGSGLTLYSCRHSFACHFLTGGGAITDLSAQLGHSSVQTTMIYAQMMDERRKATLLALDFGTAPGAPKDDATKGNEVTQSKTQGNTRAVGG